MTDIPTPTDFLRFNADDARKLFERLDHIHLVAILPDAPKGAMPHGRYFGADAQAAVDWAASANGNGSNVYWTLNYVGPGVGTKPKKADIQAARGAHCDLDPPKDGQAWDKGAAIAALHAHAVPPTLIIDSGNGVQPAWLLDAPEKDWRRIEATNEALRDAFGGDDCHNIDRLLRVPGSINYPGKAKRERGCVPCMATWVQEDTGQRYKAGDLVEAFPAKARKAERATAETEERVPTQTGSLIAAIRRGDNWHNNLLKLTAHLVAKGRATVEILAMADCLTLDGYTVDETRADMRGMIADARAKWDYAEPHDEAAAAAMGYVDQDGAWTAYGPDWDQPGDPSPEQALEPLPSLDMASLAATRAAAIEFVVERIIPLGEVTLFTGPGSAGKSLFCQQLATSAAAGMPCLGLEVQPGPTLYLTCEDDAQQLHWRQQHLCEALGVPMASLADRLHLVSLRGELGNEIATFGHDGKLAVTNTYRRLLAKIQATGAHLVFLDNVAHLFAGNENDRGEVTRFCNLLNRIAAETGAAIVLVGHPSKPPRPDVAGHTYSGSTAWLNAVRSQFTIAHDTETDLRTINLSKANYAAKGDVAKFRWYNWAFVRDEDLPSDTRAGLAEIVVANGENAAFLSCLKTATANRRAVSHHPGANYYGKIFPAMPEGKGRTRKAFEKAFERLLSLGAIELDKALWQRENRSWKYGIKVAGECTDPPAPTPCTDQHQPPAESPGNPCTDPHALTPPYINISGAAHRPAAPVEVDEFGWPLDEVHDG